MKHNLLKYMEDIRPSVIDVEKYAENISSLTELEQNQMLFDAICRRLSIIGEALYKAEKAGFNVSITDKKKIIGLRHLIVHDYDLIREENIYNIIIKKLPLLRKEVESVIEDWLNRNKE